MSNETPTTMVIHGLVVGLVAYLVMVYLLSQPTVVAETRAVALALAVALYMVVFGHGMPSSVNPLLF